MWLIFSLLCLFLHAGYSATVPRANVIVSRSAAEATPTSTHAAASTKLPRSHYPVPHIPHHWWEVPKLAVENAEKDESNVDNVILPRDKAPPKTGLDDHVDEVLKKIKDKNPVKDKPVPNKLAILFLTADYLERNGLTMEGAKRTKQPPKVISKKDVAPIIKHYTDLVNKMHPDGLLKRDMSEADIDSMAMTDKRAVDGTVESTASPSHRTVWGPPGHPHGHGPVVFDRTKSFASKPTATTTGEDKHLSSRSVSDIEAHPLDTLQDWTPALDLVQCALLDGPGIVTIRVPPEWVEDTASCSMITQPPNEPDSGSPWYSITFKNGTVMPFTGAIKIIHVTPVPIDPVKYPWEYYNNEDETEETPTPSDAIMSRSVSDSASDAPASNLIPTPGPDEVVCKHQNTPFLPRVTALPDWLKADKKNIVSCTYQPPEAFLLTPLQYTTYTVTFKNGTEAGWRTEGLRGFRKDVKPIKV